MDNKKKTLSLKIDAELHRKLKRLSVDENTTMQNYVIKLIEQNFKERGIK